MPSSASARRSRVDCPLDGHPASARGWVVPVVYATRAGEATGKETIKITTRQYYFWFLGDTIAGITPRIETCPGLGTVFADLAPPAAAAGDAALASPAKADAAEPAKPAKQKRTKAAAGKHGTTAKKPAAASAKADRAATAADVSHDKVRYELKW